MAPESGEVLIGKDFIALPEEKVLELLSLPENEEKMILPVYPDSGTRLVVEPYRDKEGDKHLVLLYDLKERVLFNPTTSGVKFTMILMGSGDKAQSYGCYILKNNRGCCVN